MGFEVLFESYVPIFVSMNGAKADLRSDSWFEFYGDRMLGGDFYLNSMERYTDSLKEVLKQKMLNHEAMFRKQVYELHRLYRIQKNMMKDHNWKGSNKFAAQTAIPQLGTFAFQMTSGCARSGEEKISLMPWLYEIDKARQFSKFDSGTDHMQAHVMLLQQNGKHMSRTQVDNKVTLNDCEGIDCKRLKFQQKTLDLQLAADEYIDSIAMELEDGNLKTSVSECLETNNFLTSNIVVDPEEVNLTLSIGEDKIKQGVLRGSISNRCNSLYNRSIIDLGKSPQEIFREEATTSSLFDLAASTSSVEEKNGSQLPTQSDPTFLVRTRKDSQCMSIWNHSLAEHGGSRQELKSASLDAGLREGIGNPFIDVFNEKQQPASFASMHVDLNRIRGVQLEGSPFTSYDQIAMFPSPSTIFRGLADESHSGTHSLASCWRKPIDRTSKEIAATIQFKAACAKTNFSHKSTDVLPHARLISQPTSSQASTPSVKFSRSDWNQAEVDRTVLESASKEVITALSENSGKELPWHRCLNRGHQLGHCDSQCFSDTNLDKLRLVGHVTKGQGLTKISNASGDTVTEESVHLTRGLSSRFLHSDIRGDAIAIGSTDKIGSLYSLLGSVDLPQLAGDAEARRVCTEKSEEDTLSSRLIKNCVIVQAAASQMVEEKVTRNCRDLLSPVGHEPNFIDENNSSNIIDLESTAGDEPKQKLANLSALEPSEATRLELCQ